MGNDSEAINNSPGFVDGKSSLCTQLHADKKLASDYVGQEINKVFKSLPTNPLAVGIA